ncbi:unnamed protein product [Caenorhabditis auriculariae]|uniref:G-protein coupled receptors family 1 profile domain-containing protein n=1 Tax=Caenorhabditis auriculariae TaxID=2777116 RepID=A0A8S1HWZ2_9PELO|nr:unnamed protein product [Caenorhabditis auriculariae]
MGSVGQDGFAEHLLHFSLLPTPLLTNNRSKQARQFVPANFRVCGNGMFGLECKFATRKTTIGVQVRVCGATEKFVVSDVQLASRLCLAPSFTPTFHVALNSSHRTSKPNGKEGSLKTLLVELNSEEAWMSFPEQTAFPKADVTGFVPPTPLSAQLHFLASRLLLFYRDGGGQRRAPRILNDEMESNVTEEPVDCGLQPHDFLEVKFFLISVVGTLIGLFGLFGNATTALILTRPSMRNPNNLFLTALAVFDSCLLITAFFIYAMEYIIEYTKDFELYVAWLTYLRFAFALSHISQTGSVYITVAVTIERYFAVCHARTSKIMCGSGGAAWTILGVTTFSVLFNCTKFFELQVTINPDCPDGKDWQSYILLPSTMASNPIYQQVYSLWVTNVVMVFFPFLTLFLFNSIIAYTIRRSLEKYDFHNQKISNRNELKEKSREATLVLVIIVCIFLGCNFWGFVLTLLERIVGQETLMVEHKIFYTFSREAINFLAIINSSINFVIYLLFGRDFRKELVVVYGCGMRGITLKLPVQDKFSIWRHWTKRSKNIRRSISVSTRSVRHKLSLPANVVERTSLEGLEQTRFLATHDENLRTQVSPIHALRNGSLSMSAEVNSFATRATLLENGKTFCSLANEIRC